jgi:hypothetical protein
MPRPRGGALIALDSLTIKLHIILLHPAPAVPRALPTLACCDGGKRPRSLHLNPLAEGKGWGGASEGLALWVGDRRYASCSPVHLGEIANLSLHGGLRAGDGRARRGACAPWSQAALGTAHSFIPHKTTEERRIARKSSFPPRSIARDRQTWWARAHRSENSSVDALAGWLTRGPPPDLQGLLTIIKKVKAKEKEMRLLMV